MKGINFSRTNYADWSLSNRYYVGTNFLENLCHRINHVHVKQGKGEVPNKQIVHIYKEANQCANALAKLGASSLDFFIIYLSLPPVVESILTSDKACL